jgi:hypothetical protein
MAYSLLRKGDYIPNGGWPQECVNARRVRSSSRFIPTQSYFMAALGTLKIPWEKWVRWLLPLLLIWLALGMAAVIIAQALHFGPF